jgi:hypothetical protein
MGTTREVLFEVFDVGTVFLEVFDVGTLVLEDINILIDGAIVGSEILDGFLVLVVVSNQGILVLGSFDSHLQKGAGKWYRETKGAWRGGLDHREKRV